MGTPFVETLLALADNCVQNYEGEREKSFELNCLSHVYVGATIHM